MEGRRLPLAPYVTDVAGMLKELDGTAKGGRKTMLMDFVRPSPPHRIDNKTSVIDEANTVFKVVFPDGTEMKSMSGDEKNVEVAANNGAIADKVAEFCGMCIPRSYRRSISRFRRLPRLRSRTASSIWGSSRTSTQRSPTRSPRTPRLARSP